MFQRYDWIGLVLVLLLFGWMIADMAVEVHADRGEGRLVPYEGSEHIPMGQ